MRPADVAGAHGARGRRARRLARVALAALLAPAGACATRLPRTPACTAAPVDGAGAPSAGERSADAPSPRWAPERWPLRLWIAPRQPHLRDEALGDAPYLVAVRAAAGAWGDVVPGLRFVLVADSARADVRVRWSAGRLATGAGGWTAGSQVRASAGERWSIGGVARVVAEGGAAIADAEIVLATVDAGDTPFTPAAVRRHALHELGHVLGLPHATVCGALMHAHPSATHLVESDRAALRALYAEHRAAPAATPIAAGPAAPAAEDAAVPRRYPPPSASTRARR